MMARIDQDPDIQRQASVILPIISFELVGLSYDKSRKLNTIQKTVVNSTNASKFNYVYSPVPYDLDFKVYIYVKNAEDGTKIIEQILPFFTPDWTIGVKLLKNIPFEMNIPVILKNIFSTDTYDGEFTNRRMIVWELDLSVKGYLFGPVKQAYSIQFIDNNVIIGDPSTSNTIVASISVQPGLTSNGTPTSNSSISIPFNEIFSSDDYEIVTAITDGLDI